MTRFLLTTASLFGALALAPTVGSTVAQTVQLDGLAEQLNELDAAHAAFIRRGKIKKRACCYYKVVVVVGDDTTNNEVDTVEVTLSPTDGGPDATADVISVPLKKVKDNGNKRFVYKTLSFESDDAVDYTYQLTMTMLDVDGNAVGETVVEDVTVEDQAPPKTRTPSIEQLDDTNFEFSVTVTSDDDDEVTRVDVEITDLIGNPATPDSFTLEEFTRDNKGRKVYTLSTLTFDDPSGATDQAYGVVVTLYNADNVSLGASDYEVVVEGLDVF